MSHHPDNQRVTIAPRQPSSGAPWAWLIAVIIVGILAWAAWGGTSTSSVRSNETTYSSESESYSTDNETTYSSDDTTVDTSSDNSSGSFCSTHSCIDNYPNGTGYTVECEDGTFSQSGGRRGACSHHGGEE